MELFFPGRMLKGAKVHASIVAAIVNVDKRKILFSYKVTEEPRAQRSLNEINPRGGGASLANKELCTPLRLGVSASSGAA